MPEVVVTKVTTTKPDNADEEGENDEGDGNKLQAPEKGGRIWNLLPVNNCLFQCLQ